MHVASEKDSHSAVVQSMTKRAFVNVGKIPALLSAPSAVYWSSTMDGSLISF